jgi:hypothetical protein
MYEYYDEVVIFPYEYNSIADAKLGIIRLKIDKYIPITASKHFKISIIKCPWS